MKRLWKRQRAWESRRREKKRKKVFFLSFTRSQHRRGSIPSSLSFSRPRTDEEEKNKGRPRCLFLSLSLSCSFSPLPSKLAHNKRHKTTKTLTKQLQLPLQVHHHRRHGRRQVVPAAPVHRQALPARPRPDDRRGVWRAHGPDRRQGRQAADLGHGRPGVVQVDHEVLLPRRGG